MTKRISSFILILSFFTAIIAFVSCKKELSFNLNNKFKISEKFFNNPHSTNKIVLRVIDEIKKRNDKNEFVSEFAISNGYPIWDKPVISIPSNQSYKVNSINNVEISQTDTFAYFPIVIENSDQINGFILAKINNGIELIYSLSKDYKAFSFLNDGSNLNDASKFVLTNLLLNKEVFGVAEYEIIDNRLFTGDPEHDVASKLSIEGQLNAGDCVIINWQTNHCGTPTTACCTDSDGCDGLNGTCPTGQCYMNNSSVEICTAPNGVNWPSGGIGVSTTGGGSGGSSGGGEIPHYYPCQSNSFLKPSDPIPPCPEPGPGSGWNPVTEIVPDINIIGNFLDDPNTGEDDPTVISFDYYQNPWPTISNVISTSQFVGYDNRNCLTLAKAQIAIAGVQDLGYAYAYKIFDAQGGPYPNIAKSGVDYIITKLQLRIPVIIGVDNHPGTPSQLNADGITDHFVTIVGCGQDIRGKYFTFFDNATNNVFTGTSPSNKLYYHETTGIISGHSATTYAQSTTYIVTQIRKNN